MNSTTRARFSKPSSSSSSAWNDEANTGSSEGVALLGGPSQCGDDVITTSDPEVAMGRPVGSASASKSFYRGNTGNNSTNTNTNLTWKDQFYANDENVVAVFDMDYDEIQRKFSMRRKGYFGCVIGYVILFLMFGYDSYYGRQPLLHYLVFLWLPLAFLTYKAVEANKTLHLLMRRHVAMGHDCVYLDETDHRGERTTTTTTAHTARLVKRHSTPFSHIDSCTVTDSGWWSPSFHAVMFTNGSARQDARSSRTTTTVVVATSRTVWGLTEPQVFADCLMEAVRRSRATGPVTHRQPE